MNPISLIDLEKEWDKMKQAEIDQFVEYINGNLIKKQYKILKPIDNGWGNIEENSFFDKPYFQDVINKYINLGYIVELTQTHRLVRTYVGDKYKWYQIWKDVYEYPSRPFKVLTITPKLEKK